MILIKGILIKKVCICLNDFLDLSLYVKIFSWIFLQKMLKFMANFRFHPKIGVAYIKMELLIKENVYAGKGSLNNYVTQKHFHPNHPR